MDKKITPLKNGTVKPLWYIKKLYIIRSLCTLNWNQTETAKQLKISVMTVRNTIEEFRADGYEIPSFDQWGNRRDETIKEARAKRGLK